MSLVDGEGRPVPLTCSLTLTGGTEHHATLPGDGTWHVRMSDLAGAYRFGFTLDAPPLAHSDAS